MSKDYKDEMPYNPNTDEDRQQRVKKKKKNGVAKTILIIIGLIIIAFAVFLLTIKIAEPDFKLSSIVGKNASQFVDEKILEKTTTTTTVPATVPSTRPSSEATTVSTTKKEVETPGFYLPIEEFALKDGAKGNYVGNILQGGKVGMDSSYIYHIADNKGIYRFEPNNESYTRIYKSDNKLSSLNLRGEYIYFVNDDENVLYRLTKGQSKPKKISDNVKTAYVYDKLIYVFTTQNSIKTIATDTLKETELYSSSDELNLIGVSLNAVFFTVTDAQKNVNYVTVDNANVKGEQLFRQPTSDDELVSPMLENGFLYYFEKQEDGSYNLCRQKYGSKKTVTLVENVTCLNPVIVYENRLYYGELDNSRFKMRELNMNNDEVKTLLYVKNADNDNKLIFQHGGEYDFIIGNKNSDGDEAYSASSRYTGNENIMNFKDGKWSY